MTKKALLENARVCARAMSDEISEKEAETACDNCRIKHLLTENCDGFNGPRELILRLTKAAENQHRLMAYKITVGGLVLLCAGTVIHNHTRNHKRSLNA